MKRPNRARSIEIGYKWSSSDGSSADTLSSFTGLGYDITTGSDVTDWQTKISKRQDASSDYSATFADVKPIVIRADSRYTSPTTLRTTYNTGVAKSISGYSFPYLTDSDAQALALKKIKARLRGLDNNFSSIAPVAELREANKMIKTSVNVGMNFLRTVHDLRRGKFKDIQSRLADHWLNYAFAVSPTISDLESIYASIKDQLAAQPKVEHIRGTQSAFSKDSVQGYQQQVNFDLWAYVDVTVHKRVKYKYVAGYEIPVSGANEYRSFQDRWGLNMRDLPSAIYELTPYSWFLDYFVNVGDYIDDTFYSPSGVTFYVNLVTQQTNVIRQSARPYPSVGTEIVNFSSSFGTMSFKNYTRTNLVALPRTSLRYVVQDNDLKSSLKKLTNVAAILLK